MTTFSFFLPRNCISKKTTICACRCYRECLSAVSLWDMITELFSSAVRQCFLSLPVGCWPQLRSPRWRGASRNSPPGMVFACEMKSTLVKPCCQVHTHKSLCMHPQTQTGLKVFLSWEKFKTIQTIKMGKQATKQALSWYNITLLNINKTQGCNPSFTVNSKAW